MAPRLHTQSPGWPSEWPACRSPEGVTQSIGSPAARPESLACVCRSGRIHPAPRGYWSWWRRSLDWVKAVCPWWSWAGSWRSLRPGWRRDLEGGRPAPSNLMASISLRSPAELWWWSHQGGQLPSRVWRRYRGDRKGSEGTGGCPPCPGCCWGSGHRACAYRVALWACGSGCRTSGSRSYTPAHRRAPWNAILLEWSSFHFMSCFKRRKDVNQTPHIYGKFALKLLWFNTI